ncbi:MAG: iron chelate uptake ABC transporter family permease subunit [Acidiferrobacteraceae bacterium]
MIDSRQNLLTLGLGLLAIVSFWFAIASGSVPLHWSQVWHALGHGGVDTDSRIVVELRLPRATLAFCVGAMLSLSGALLQVLLRNPLADPYVLGVSGGAAVAALLSMVAGAGAALVAGNAFLGALLSMVLVFTLSGRGGTLAPLRLLLTGVVLAAGWGALISLILSIGPATDIRGMLFWLMGDLGQSRFPLVALGTMLIGLAASMMLARPLNLLVRGERVTATLGEDPLRLLDLCPRLDADCGCRHARGQHRLCRTHRSPLAAACGNHGSSAADSKQRASRRQLAAAGRYPCAHHHGARPVAGGRGDGDVGCPPVSAVADTDHDAMKGLQIRKLTLRAGDRTLVRDLDLDLDAGQTWAILGPNGSGKTTLLHTLAGLRPPAAGAIRVDGQPLADLSARARARQIGVLFQDDEAAFPSSVLDIALSGRYPHGSPGWFSGESAQDLEWAHNALKTVDLAGFESRQVSSLSGGERRRLEIAALLAQNPEIRLLDEPTNHLDLRHQSAILDILVSGAGKAGLSVLVLHDPGLAARYCTHAILLPSDGTHIHGAASDVLRIDALEQTYGCRITEIRQGGYRFYVPE